MVSILVVFVLVFISGGALMTSLVGSQQIQETVSYSTDDVNELAEARVNSEIYRFNIRKELNYTFNNVAYEIGGEAGELNWQDNIPTMSDVNATLKRQLLNRQDINIVEQNRAGRCEPPEIDESVLKISSRHRLELRFSDPWIECTGPDTAALVPVEDNFAIQNPENNYFNLAEDAIELTNESLDIIKNTEWSRNGSVKNPMSYVDVPDDSFNNACYHLSGSDENQADNDAQQSAREQYDDMTIASDAYTNLESEGKLYSFLNDLELSTEIEGEISESADYPESQSCTYRRCTDTETTCDEDGDCSTSCVERAPEQEKSYNLYKYRFDADKAFVGFNLEDADNSVITYDSRETTLNFNFTYVNDEDVDGM